jgi:hypothetical protein
MLPCNQDVSTPAQPCGAAAVMHVAYMSYMQYMRAPRPPRLPVQRYSHAHSCRAVPYACDMTYACTGCCTNYTLAGVVCADCRQAPCCDKASCVCESTGATSQTCAGWPLLHRTAPLQVSIHGLLMPGSAMHGVSASSYHSTSPEPLPHPHAVHASTRSNVTPRCSAARDSLPPRAASMLAQQRKKATQAMARPCRHADLGSIGPCPCCTHT